MAKNLLFKRSLRIVFIFVLCIFWFGLYVDSVNSDENRNEKHTHEDIICANCHSFGSKIKKFENKRCISCHNQLFDDNFISDNNFHNDKTRQCTDCHSFHNSNNLIIEKTKTQYDLVSKQGAIHCYTCHSVSSNLSLLSEGHRDARILYHNNSQNILSLSLSQGCMLCHGSSYSSTSNNSSMPVINNHASHPYEIDVIPGEGNSTNRIRFEIDPRIKLFDNRIECLTCHNLSAEEDDLLVNFEEPLDFCNGCHEHISTNTSLADTR